MTDMPNGLDTYNSTSLQMPFKISRQTCYNNPLVVRIYTSEEKVKFRYSGSKLSLMQRVALCYIALLS